MDQTPIVIADADGVIRFWSAGATLAFGHAAALAVGRKLDLIVPEEVRDQHWTGFRRAMATGAAGVEGQPGPFTVRRADGQEEERIGTLTLLRRPDGRTIGAMVVFS
jgi:PAS domain S-box-containing protein